MNANSDSSGPAACALTPSYCTRIVGSHANEAYAMVEEVANTAASAQASGILGIRAKMRPFEGATTIGPVAAATASSRETSRPSRIRSSCSGPGSGSAAVSSRGAPIRSRTSMTIHGIVPASANTAHIESEVRHPAVSAIGTATSGGRKVEKAMTVV